ncbi:hypothetical protein BK147_18635 [Paenibacillus sp. FSL R7-0337]|nr:hypothetical protein BK147_18635 [Paenibacillus sp. FSL R7-0337]
MTEVYPSFEKLLHGDYCHLHTPPSFGLLCVSSAARHLSARLSSEESTSCRNQPACVLTPSINISY